MLSAGIQNPALLDELESHLRDAVEAKIREGQNPDAAFAEARLQMGSPDRLRREFEKLPAWEDLRDRLRQFLLTWAGFSQPAYATAMNTPSILPQTEPAWVTYLKSATFLLPAALLWIFSSVFLIPKLKKICMDTGMHLPGVYNLTDFAGRYAVFIGAALLLSLVLLERRLVKWPQFRRPCMGVAVFLLNGTVMVLITVLVVLALVAAPQLGMHR
jgi:hypothetical protein